jgi:hypothetical protein
MVADWLRLVGTADWLRLVSQALGCPDRIASLGWPGLSRRRAPEVIANAPGHALGFGPTTRGRQRTEVTAYVTLMTLSMWLRFVKLLIGFVWWVAWTRLRGNERKAPADEHGGMPPTPNWLRLVRTADWLRLVRTVDWLRLVTVADWLRSAPGFQVDWLRLVGRKNRRCDWLRLVTGSDGCTSSS